MHGAGIYRAALRARSCAGLTRAPEAEAEVETFVAEQEVKFGGDPGEHRGRLDELLELFDRLSLYFCMRDVEAGEPAELQGYRLEPVAPWHVRCQPVSRSARRRPSFSARCGACCPNQGRRTFSSVTPERVAITVEA